MFLERVSLIRDINKRFSTSNGKLTSGKTSHDVEFDLDDPVIAPALLDPEDCVDDFSPHLPLVPNGEDMNSMNMAEDESTPGLNGRLRPRKSNTPSLQIKIAKKFENKITLEKTKKTNSTLSKALLNKSEDLANKSGLLSTSQLLCQYCDKRFASKQTVSKHVNRTHFSNTKVDSFISCLFCNHNEADGNEIIRHMVDSHPNQYFACLDCHTRFSSTSELAEHKLNVCEKHKPYRSKLRQKAQSALKKGPKNLNDEKYDFGNNKQYLEKHGFNGVVISCELKPSQVVDDDDIEDNITTNLILPPSKNLSNNPAIEKNAVIVLDDIQWNKRIPSNFSFHNTDADQILSRLGVVHRSPRTGHESTRRDCFKICDDSTHKFEKCFDTSFYSKVASNVQENLAKCLDGSFNFHPDLENTIKTRKAKNSVVINTAEGFPILLAFEQYSRNPYDSYLPRGIAPKHKWKWDSLDNDKSLIHPDVVKRDSHDNNCIITLISSLDIWTQLCMRRKYEQKFHISQVVKKTEKQNMIEKELKEILESREIPTMSSLVVNSARQPTLKPNSLDFPTYLGLTPSVPDLDLQPAVLSGEWVRPRCYVCCACGAQTTDSRALSSHITIQHPNSQVQHYEIVGEPLLNADILKHLYVPPSQVYNRTRPLRGFRDCTKCQKSITLEDLHQHMLDCAGDTPAVRRKCRYRPFGVRKRRPRLPSNILRRKMRKNLRNRCNNKVVMRPRPKIRTEVGDAETIRKMIADLPAKRHRVMINPMNPSLRQHRNHDKLRNKLIIKRLSSEDSKNRRLRTVKERHLHNTIDLATVKKQEQSDPASRKIDDNENMPLKKTVTVPETRDAVQRKTVTNRPKKKLQMKDVTIAQLPEPCDAAENCGLPNNRISDDNLSGDNKQSEKINVNDGQNNNKHSERGGGDINHRNMNRGNANRGNESGNNREYNNLNRSNGSGQNPSAPNVPLKHSIANLTANTETHDKSVQFHHLFLIQQECNAVTETRHVLSEQKQLFEKEETVPRLDKPPLTSKRKSVDETKIPKNKSNKPRKGLNDCIAMLKNKLAEPETKLLSIGQISVQCGGDDPIDTNPIVHTEDNKSKTNLVTVDSPLAIPQKAMIDLYCTDNQNQQIAKDTAINEECVAKPMISTKCGVEPTALKKYNVPNIVLETQDDITLDSKSTSVVTSDIQQKLITLPSQIEIIPQTSTGSSKSNKNSLVHPYQDQYLISKASLESKVCRTRTQSLDTQSDSVQEKPIEYIKELKSPRKIEYYHKTEQLDRVNDLKCFTSEAAKHRSLIDQRPLLRSITYSEQRQQIDLISSEPRAFTDHVANKEQFPSSERNSAPDQKIQKSEYGRYHDTHSYPEYKKQSSQKPSTDRISIEQRVLVEPRGYPDSRMFPEQNIYQSPLTFSEMSYHKAKSITEQMPPLDHRTYQEQISLLEQRSLDQRTYAEHKVHPEKRSYGDQRMCVDQRTNTEHRYHERNYTNCRSLSQQIPYLEMTPLGKKNIEQRALFMRRSPLESSIIEQAHTLKHWPQTEQTTRQDNTKVAITSHELRSYCEKGPRELELPQDCRQSGTRRHSQERRLSLREQEQWLENQRVSFEQIPIFDKISSQKPRQSYDEKSTKERRPSHEHKQVIVQTVMHDLGASYDCRTPNEHRSPSEQKTFIDPKSSPDFRSVEQIFSHGQRVKLDQIFTREQKSPRDNRSHHDQRTQQDLRNQQDLRTQMEILTQQGLMAHQELRSTLELRPHYEISVNQDLRTFHEQRLIKEQTNLYEQRYLHDREHEKLEQQLQQESNFQPQPRSSNEQREQHEPQVSLECRTLSERRATLELKASEHAQVNQSVTQHESRAANQQKHDKNTPVEQKSQLEQKLHYNHKADHIAQHEQVSNEDLSSSKLTHSEQIESRPLREEIDHTEVPNSNTRLRVLVKSQRNINSVNSVSKSESGREEKSLLQDNSVNQAKTTSMVEGEQKITHDRNVQEEPCGVRIRCEKSSCDREHETRKSVFQLSTFDALIQYNPRHFEHKLDDVKISTKSPSDLVSYNESQFTNEKRSPNELILNDQKKFVEDIAIGEQMSANRQIPLNKQIFEQKSLQENLSDHNSLNDKKKLIGQALEEPKNHNQESLSLRGQKESNQGPLKLYMIKNTTVHPPKNQCTEKPLFPCNEHSELDLLRDASAKVLKSQKYTSVTADIPPAHASSNVMNDTTKSQPAYHAIPRAHISAISDIAPEPTCTITPLDLSGKTEGIIIKHVRPKKILKEKHNFATVMDLRVKSSILATSEEIEMIEVQEVHGAHDIIDRSDKSGICPATAISDTEVRGHLPGLKIVDMTLDTEHLNICDTKNICVAIDLTDDEDNQLKNINNESHCNKSLDNKITLNSLDHIDEVTKLKSNQCMDIKTSTTQATSAAISSNFTKPANDPLHETLKLKEENKPFVISTLPENRDFLTTTQAPNSMISTLAEICAPGTVTNSLGVLIPSSLSATLYDHAGNLSVTSRLPYTFNETSFDVDRTLPDYNLPSSVLSTQMKKFESTVPVYTLSNACISMSKIASPETNPPSSTYLTLTGSTIANTKSVYTLAGPTMTGPVNYGDINSDIPSVEESDVNNSTLKSSVIEPNISENIDQDPETARKIAMLPRELVEILGTMPADHRKQLLEVLPQYVSTSTTECSAQSKIETENIKTSSARPSDIHGLHTSDMYAYSDHRDMSTLNAYAPNYHLVSNVPHFIDNNHSIPFLLAPPPPPPPITQSNLVLPSHPPPPSCEIAAFVTQPPPPPPPSLVTQQTVRAALQPPPPPPPPSQSSQYTFLSPLQIINALKRPPPPPKQPPPLQQPSLLANPLEDIQSLTLLVQQGPPPPPPMPPSLKEPLLLSEDLHQEKQHAPEGQEKSSPLVPLLNPPLPTTTPPPFLEEDIKPIIIVFNNEDSPEIVNNNIADQSTQVKSVPEYGRMRDNDPENETSNLVNDVNQLLSDNVRFSVNSTRLMPSTSRGINNDNVSKKSTKDIWSNDKTASLRAVRIKAPSERNKSLSSEDSSKIEPQTPKTRAQINFETEERPKRHKSTELEVLNTNDSMVNASDLLLLQKLEEAPLLIKTNFGFQTMSANAAEQVPNQDPEESTRLELNYIMEIQKSEVTSTQHTNKHNTLPTTVTASLGASTYSISQLQTSILSDEIIVSKSDKVQDMVPTAKQGTTQDCRETINIGNANETNIISELNCESYISKHNTAIDTKSELIEGVNEIIKKSGDEDSEDDVLLAEIVKQKREMVHKMLEQNNSSENIYPSNDSINEIKSIQNDIKDTNVVTDNVHTNKFINPNNDKIISTGIAYTPCELNLSDKIHSNLVNMCTENTVMEIGNKILSMSKLSKMDNKRNQTDQEFVRNNSFEEKTLVTNKSLSDKKGVENLTKPEEIVGTLIPSYKKIHPDKNLAIDENNKKEELITQVRNCQETISNESKIKTVINVEIDPKNSIDESLTSITENFIKSQDVQHENSNDCSNKTISNVEKKHRKSFCMDTSKYTQCLNSIFVDDLHTYTENENSNVTLLRRSRRGKSLFAENKISEQIISHLPEVSNESKIPLTKKQLIFSKLLLDEENYNGSTTHSTTPKDNKIHDEHVISISVPDNVTEFPLKIGLTKTKVLKRKKSPQFKRKFKKKKCGYLQREIDILMETDKCPNNKLTSECSTSGTSILYPISDVIKDKESGLTNLEIIQSKQANTGEIIEVSNVMINDKNIDNSGCLHALEETGNKKLISVKKRKFSATFTRDNSQLNLKQKRKKLAKKFETSLQKKKHNVSAVKETTLNKREKFIPPCENRTTCYMPIAALRKTRSKSVVVKSSSVDVYDPYDIDLDDMIDNSEKYTSKKNLRNKTTYGLKKRNIRNTFEKTNKAAYSKEILSDSDDSSKSDIPLMKLVEEKERKLLKSSLDTVFRKKSDDKNLRLQSNNFSLLKCNCKDNKKKTSNLKDNILKSDLPNESEDQLRSEQFMESFGFFSERKPRKSNLLASKKIAETFHTIQKDDKYFGRQRPNRRNVHVENRKTGGRHSRVPPRNANKKAIRCGRVNKMKPFIKPLPCLCGICKKEFRRPDNYLRHQMTLLHISKLSQIEMKLKTKPLHEEPNYLIVYRQQLDKLKILSKKFAYNKKKNPKSKIKFKLPTLDEILVDVDQTVREQHLSQRGLSRDEALFLDCCELLKSNKNDLSTPETSNINTNTVRNKFSVGVTETTVKEFDLLEKPSKGDGDVDSITAKNILESEEVRNLEKDLISGLKEAAKATRKSKMPFQRSVSDVELNNSEEASVSYSGANSYEHMHTYEIEKESSANKAKKLPEVKEKKYPNIIDSINMFEDKFDKIKRKCRSQAAAAKHTQTVVAEVKMSHRVRRKSEKRKGKRRYPKNTQFSHVPTKGALKGFDGIKISIPTTDINMSAIVSSKGNSTKKKRKNNSKKKKLKRESDSGAKFESHAQNKGSSSLKTVDVYEFMDNDDAELFEFRPSTLMERFKSISNKDTPNVSKSNPVFEYENSESFSDGDDFVYMSDDYVCSDDETESSLLSCEMNSNKICSDVKKNLSILKRKDAVEKSAVMGKIFKNNAVRNEKKTIKAKETSKPKANLDQLFDSLLEEEPNSSLLNNDPIFPIREDFPTEQKHVQLSKSEKYDQTPASRYEHTLLTESNSPSPKGTSSSKHCELSTQSNKTKFEFSSITKYNSCLTKSTDLNSSEHISPNKCDLTTSKRQDLTYSKNSTVHNQTSAKSEDNVFYSPQDTKNKFRKDKSPSSKLDEGISTSYDFSADAFEHMTYDGMGVARQRARRKCTVGKQNVLAETWSSESEPDVLPPRPNSTESVVPCSTRKKKAKKKESHTGSRRGNNRHVMFKKYDLVNKLCNSRASRGSREDSDGALIDASPYNEPLPSTSHAPLVLSAVRPRPRASNYYWSSEGDEEQELPQQHGWIVGDSHKKLVTMLAHAKGRKRSVDKSNLVE